MRLSIAIFSLFFLNAYGRDFTIAANELLEPFNDAVPDLEQEPLSNLLFRIDKTFAIGSYNKVNWFTAQQLCSERGMTLATLNSATEAMSLRNYLVANGLQDQSFWLSGTNLAGLSTWYWLSNGKPIINYTNWMPGEPNNLGGNEHCLAVAPNGQWNDLNCGNGLYFICENRCPLNSYNVPLVKK